MYTDPCPSRRPRRGLLLAGLAAGLSLLPAASATAQSTTPIITSMSPDAAVAGSGGLTLYVNGTNFRPGVTVRWNGAARPTTRVNGGRIYAAIPAGDLAVGGAVQVTVHDPATNATSAPATFQVVPRPVITAVTPDRVAAGGEPFTLAVEGTGFAPDAWIEWNGAPLTTSGTPTRLTAAIAASRIAAPATVAITVVNPGEFTATSAPRHVTIAHDAPAIAALSPSSADQGGGAFKLTVRGRNFIRTGTTVLWNGSPRQSSWVSPTEVRVGIAASDLAQAGVARVAVRTQVGRSVRESRPADFGVNPLVVATPARPMLGIRSFQLGGGRPFVSTESSVTLDAATIGDPTVYRAAQRRQGCEADLASVSWTSYSAARPPSMRLRGTGTQRVCFEVGRGGASAPTASVAAEASIQVVPWLIKSPPIGTSREVVGLLPDRPREMVQPWRLAIGLQVRSGTLIDRIAVRQALLGPNGERSNVTTSDGQGGTGGTLRTLDCPAGQAMVGVRGRRGVVIDRIEVACRPFRAATGTFGSVSWIGPAGGNGGDTSFSFVCPPPHAVLVVGAAVTGSYVSGLQLACLPPTGV